PARAPLPPATHKCGCFETPLVNLPTQGRCTPCAGTRCAPGHPPSIHRPRDCAVPAIHPVVVPPRPRLRPVLGRKGAISTTTVDRDHLRAMNREDIAIRRVPRAFPAIEHLDFNPANERLAPGGECVGPDEHARVALRLQMPPFQLEDEVLIHPGSA